MMFKNSKRIITTGTWAASSDLTPVDIPREGLITELIVRAVITATLTATALSDATRRVIQNLKLVGDGGRTYLGLSGEQAARLLSFMNLCDYGHEFASPGGVLTTIDVGSTTFEQSFVAHFGSNPKDPFDLTAAIPARALSTLQALLTTTADTVVDAAGLITAGTYRYQINQVLDVPVPAGLMCPLGSTMVWAHDANYSDYSKKIDVPAGAWLRRIVMLVQDGTAITPLRKNDEVTAVKLELPKAANKEVLSFLWQSLLAETAKIYGYPGSSQSEAAVGAIATTRPGYYTTPFIPHGLAIIDLRKYFHPLYGMDLTPYQTGDVKLGLTVENYAAGDDTLIYWDQLQPVESQYVGK
jgi:hypothetical protein